MSEKESITTLLTLLDSRQARLAAACKEIADWVDNQGGASDSPQDSRSSE